MQDKNSLIDVIADKDEEIHHILDPHPIQNLGTINAELESYIRSITSIKDE